MSENHKTKAIGLVSGGLDSCLAARILIDQGVEVIGLHIITPFFTKVGKGGEDEHLVERQAKEIGFAYHPLYPGQEYIDLIRNPEFGYGANYNPCIDCHIYFTRKAAEVMEEENAQFIFTGEVVGQRPMSQNRPTLRQIEKHSGVEGYLLRPLSAKILPPTIPEKLGWVNREALLDWAGRGRSRQMRLAEKYGLEHYESPAGGCLLTDPHHAPRIRDLFNAGYADVNSVKLMQAGRYFHLGEDAILVVGRHESDNRILANLAREDDILLEAEGGGSPLSVYRGKEREDLVNLAAAITRRYSRARKNPETPVKITNCATGKIRKVTPPLITPKETSEYMI